MENEDSAGEVRVGLEEGKRKKVVRRGRFCIMSASAGDMDVEGLIRALRKLPDADKQRCMRKLGQKLLWQRGFGIRRG